LIENFEEFFIVAQPVVLYKTIVCRGGLAANVRERNRIARNFNI